MTKSMNLMVNLTIKNQISFVPTPDYRSHQHQEPTSEHWLCTAAEFRWIH